MFYDSLSKRSRVSKRTVNGLFFGLFLCPFIVFGYDYFSGNLSKVELKNNSSLTYVVDEHGNGYYVSEDGVEDYHFSINLDGSEYIVNKDDREDYDYKLISRQSVISKGNTLKFENVVTGEEVKIKVSHYVYANMSKQMDRFFTL